MPPGSNLAGSFWPGLRATTYTSERSGVGLATLSGWMWPQFESLEALAGLPSLHIARSFL